ncbi:MAG: B3/4 domain-containing protein [Bacillota bacterium]|nr:B3/4 domain-containing protein [Eubacteriales bacterium]MDD3536662.1 B3/4 domain-containing protein [Eubacteriales bacterium]MDD4286280.1 B3/4 domain-containing protein [Eubacteriales bacterium]MDI9492208.1 B3/4 domain-containing protein [Bacillota bacterium]NLV69307.1 B3/4 domain-containing protein [Clostridiales bacterium]
MKHIRITEPFWTLFPDVHIGVACLTGIRNTGAHPELEEGLRSANQKATAHLGKEVFSENPAVAAWREAYRRFKTKKGVRSSVENLLKRVEKGNPVGSINPLVDLYNTISLEYGLPCGGEDIDTLRGDLLLTLADGGESFLALGDEKEDPALPGEVVYKDDLGIVCRCWNWRDGMRTMLTEQTTNALLVMESVDPARHGDLAKALEDLAKRAVHALGGESRTMILDSKNDAFPLL